METSPLCLSLAVAVALRLAALAAGWTGPQPAPQAAESRAEHFVLELVEYDPDAPASDALAGSELARPAAAEELGLAVLRRRREGPRQLLEMELYFRDPEGPDTRVHHVELREYGRARCVWREYRPGAGRTLLVEKLDSGALRTVEWGGREGLRSERAPELGSRFPLELIEALREGRRPAGPLKLFQPLTGGFTAVALTRPPSAPGRPVGRAHPLVRTDPLGHPDPAAFGGRRTLASSGRTFALEREDGTLALSLRFEGAELTAFQWQAGGARARRVSAETWRRRAAELRAADRPMDGGDGGDARDAPLRRSSSDPVASGIGAHNVEAP